MTDILTRLVERTLGTVPLVQPLIAPRFTQGPSLAGDFHEEADWGQPSSEAASASPAATIPGQTEQVFSSPPDFTQPDAQPSTEITSELPPDATLPKSPPAAPLEPTLAASEPGKPNATLPVARFTPPETLPSAAEPVVTPPSSEAPGSHPPGELSPRNPEPFQSEPGKVNENVPLINQQRIIVNGHRQEPGPEAPSRRESVEAHLTTSNYTKPGREVLEPILPSGPPDIATVPQPPEHPPRIQTRSRESLSELEPSTLPALSDASSEPAPQPQPVIRVTIGRIEVRAVLPPTPSRPTASRPTPALTLDEYLKQRNGGSR